jgi:hypothetical protein
MTMVAGRLVYRPPQRGMRVVQGRGVTGHKDGTITGHPAVGDTTHSPVAAVRSGDKDLVTGRAQRPGQWNHRENVCNARCGHKQYAHWQLSNVT